MIIRFLRLSSLLPDKLCFLACCERIENNSFKDSCKILRRIFVWIFEQGGFSCSATVQRLMQSTTYWYIAWSLECSCTKSWILAGIFEQHRFWLLSCIFLHSRLCQNFFFRFYSLSSKYPKYSLISIKNPSDKEVSSNLHAKSFAEIFEREAFPRSFSFKDSCKVPHTTPILKTQPACWKRGKNLISPHIHIGIWAGAKDL